MNMNIKILKNDFKRNRAGNVSLLLFMTLAAGLVAVAAIVVTQLLTSMTSMYQTAMPPHFLQMHKGEVDQAAIDDFNASYEGVVAWQSLPMIDVYGDELTVYGQESFRLTSSRMDISLVKQNDNYDLLLNADRKPIRVKDGEIGIPVILLDAYDIRIGDKIVLESQGVSKEFTVSAYVHDAQMNSTLVSSTRMLISDSDFDGLIGRVGETEYLIETYFTDSSMASEYQTAYENANLPQNGQAVTYSIIFLLSAFRDIAMAMVLTLASVLLVLVALMCVKYTMMAALEEEIGEIGTMKAIGMSFKDIRSLYMFKYRLMVGSGVVMGYVLAMIFSSVFTDHVSRTFGKGETSVLALGIPVLVCLVLYMIASHYSKRVLKKIKKLTVVDALVFGKSFGKKERVKDGLYKSKKMPVNLILSIRETVYNLRGFAIVWIVLTIVAGIMIVPANLLTTMESKEFITYMGSAMDDILIEIDPGENIDGKYEVLKQMLLAEEGIQNYTELRRVRVETLNADGGRMNLHVDAGNQAGSELQYLEGNAPLQESEIALSKLNADEIGKGIGERIMIRYGEVEREFMISGIYQDVTSGGYTAKAVYGFPEVESEKYQFSIILEPSIEAKEKAAQWSTLMGGGYDIVPMEDFIHQTLGGVSRQIEVAVIAVSILGYLLTALIVVLYMKLRLAKDMAQIAAMKAIGFTNEDIRMQYLYKIGMVSLLGIVVGTVAANMVGESLTSGVISIMGFGITRISFVMNPWIVWLAIPLTLLAVAITMTWMSSKQVKAYNIVALINE